MTVCLAKRINSRGTGLPDYPHIEVVHLPNFLRLVLKIERLIAPKHNPSSTSTAAGP